MALFIFTTIQVIGVVFLVIGPELIYFYAFAVLFGIGFGGRTPLTTAIRGDYFGRASFGKILGISTVPMNVLLLVAAPMAGFMRVMNLVITIWPSSPWLGLIWWVRFCSWWRENLN